ncbi:MAG: hypothetical protein VXV85_05885, partial [Candidatus Thermoplasmatota archaeon]|nr:hypothetical protein [Candidatus Thermoplasmatota archaeon]
LCDEGWQWVPGLGSYIHVVPLPGKGVEVHTLALAGTVQLNPFYFPLRGSIDERMEYLSTVSDVIDGRWMLAAQHLECWRSLWTPHFTDHLPTLEQLLTWLVVVESRLEQN